ncbi:MAG: carboxypeptidase M32 [Phycisphaerales bacterium]|nr:carboxypeptidase M32 [Phycisphaerales bacterium]
MTTSTTTSTNWDRLAEASRRWQTINSITSLLHWDQETKMPSKGIDHRGRQVALLARMAHEEATCTEVGEMIAACEADDDLTGNPDSDTAINVARLRRDYDRGTKLSIELVGERAELATKAQHHWAKARAADDYAQFEPWLDKVIDLNRRMAEAFGWAEGGEPWDALAEDYEAGCTAAWVESVFTPLRERLQTLLDACMGSSTQPSNAFNEVCLPVDKQEAFVRLIADKIGFDFDRGRLDVSTHPFCSGFHPTDVRITTRFHENNLNDAIGSTMHECGHGIYEQGLRTDMAGLPLGTSVSLGIHESQSRMWENQVGRSDTFWRWACEELKSTFGNDVAHLSYDDVYGGANIVRPDFIRVEADEATYNMHIMIRFELERLMLKGELNAADVPEAWNQRYREYLGIDVPDNARGCMQDIHWSMCAMGYFPTYTLGNLYSAQLYEAACDANPDLEDGYAKGEFTALRTWLNDNVHVHGRRYDAATLCEKATGKPLSADPLMRHLGGKLSAIYGL